MLSAKSRLAYVDMTHRPLPLECVTRNKSQVLQEKDSQER